MDGPTAGGEGHLHIIQTKQTLPLPKSVAADSHAAGDDLLRCAAHALRSAFRCEDAVARIGGDEFAVLLPNTDAVTVAQVLERVRNNIASNPARCTPVALSIALGAATGSSHDSLIGIMKEADRRMYEDKAAHAAVAR